MAFDLSMLAELRAYIYIYGFRVRVFSRPIFRYSLEHLFFNIFKAVLVYIQDMFDLCLGHPSPIFRAYECIFRAVLACIFSYLSENRR